ncbi:uncharacterized protein LOC126904588 isoform X2 [Daktulosphaira vitifoliae]|nr:uncharacterized protein LOC126904588 isoform X2 [Daktulosphaira vitifoliae]
MEITAYDLILHKNSEPPIIWPLHTVRRYGFEDSMFCFEAGRSSPYGQGIFAFKSNNAKNIFNAVQGKLQNDNSTNAAKDMSSEMCNYSEQSCTSTRTIEKVYDEISFNGIKCSNESNNNQNQPPDLMLDPDTVFLPKTTYANILNDNEDEDDDILNDPFELLKDVPTYTVVEISVSSSKRKSESLPTSPTEIPGYTAIDFNRTMHLSQKMLKSGEASGMRKTRHDSTMSNP